MFNVVVPVGVTDAGVGAQVESAGMPVQVMETAELYPDKAFTLSVRLVKLPPPSR